MADIEAHKLKTVKDLHFVNESMKSLKKKYELLKAEVTEICDAKEMVGPFLVNITDASRTNVKGKDLKVDHPDIYAAYSSISDFKKVSVKLTTL